MFHSILFLTFLVTGHRCIRMCTYSIFARTRAVTRVYCGIMNRLCVTLQRILARTHGGGGPARQRRARTSCNSGSLVKVLRRCDDCNCTARRCTTGRFGELDFASWCDRRDAALHGAARFSPFDVMTAFKRPEYYRRILVFFLDIAERSRRTYSLRLFLSP